MHRVQVAGARALNHLYTSAGLRGILSPFKTKVYSPPRKRAQGRTQELMKGVLYKRGAARAVPGICVRGRGGATVVEVRGTIPRAERAKKFLGGMKQYIAVFFTAIMTSDLD